MSQTRFLLVLLLTSGCAAAQCPAGNTGRAESIADLFKDLDAATGSGGTAHQVELGGSAGLGGLPASGGAGAGGTAGVGGTAPH